MKHLYLVSWLVLCAPLPALCEDDVGHLYLNPYLGGIRPDKPWGGKGSTALYGLELQLNVSI